MSEHKSNDLQCFALQMRYDLPNKIFVIPLGLCISTNWLIIYNHGLAIQLIFSENIAACQDCKVM